MRLCECSVLGYFKNRSVLILGSAPNCTDVSVAAMSDFDVIVRTNNYKLFNADKRVDVYYSFFGRSILNIKKRVEEDNPDFLFMKYPFDFNFAAHTGGQDVAGKGGDLRFIQEINKELLKRVHHFPQTIPNFISNFCAIGSMPSTGMAAILDIIRYQPSKLAIAGFDFYKSKIHNVDEKWNPQDGKGHDFCTEEFVVAELVENNLIINLNQEVKYNA